MVELTTEQFEAAQARGQDRLNGPRAGSAHFDQERNRIVVRLTTGIELSFAPQGVQGLQDAAPEDLHEIRIDALGLGVHFPALDADLYVPALLEELLAPDVVSGRRSHAHDNAHCLP